MTVMKLRVCLISPCPPPYGGIAHWTSLLHSFAQAAGDIQLLQVDTAVRWRTIDDRSTVVRILGGMLQLLRDYVCFLRVLFQRPDVIHLTTSGSFGASRDVLICLTAHLFGVPVAYHIRFGRIPQMAKDNTWEWRVLAVPMRLASVVIAITPETATTVRNYLPAVKVVYLPNPIDFSILPPPVDQESGPNRTAVFLGWIVPTKGIAELVQAWTDLHPADWELIMAGPGEYVDREGLLDRDSRAVIRFVGELTHVEAMRLLAGASLFVFPSYSEGFPNAVLEAMALGKPIIATAVGAIPEMLSGGCGVLIEPRDVSELKAALARLLEDPKLRHELGANAYEKVRREYDVRIMYTRYVQIWHSIR